MLAGFAGARILVTHDPIDAFTLADRLLIVENGRVVQQGRPDDVLNRPQSAYVAELAGVNLYRGHADGDQIVVGDEILTAADTHRGDVIAIVPPHTVVLHRAPPEGARATCGPESSRRWSAPVAVYAYTSPERCRSLPKSRPRRSPRSDWSRGFPVWAAVKATEVDVHPG